MPSAGALTKIIRDKVAPSLRPSGTNLFDLSRLDQVPSVPQEPLERYMPKQGPSDRAADLFASKPVRRKVEATIDAGVAEGGPKWYNTDPLMQAFSDALGEAEGMAAYRRYMEMVAATSPRSRVPDNIRNASYYYSKDRQGEPMPEKGDKNPSPYGHLAQKLHQRNANVVVNDGWDVFKNPKPASFVENLAGNQMPVTIDAHALKLPAMLSRDPRWLATTTRVGKPGSYENIKPQQMFESGALSMRDALKRPALWDAQPRKNEYGIMERMYQDIGEKKGLTPAQTQASAWVGGRDVTGMGSPPAPFMELFQERVLKTAEARGENPIDTLKKFMSGEAPLLKKGGRVTRPPGLYKKGGRVGGALAYQRDC